MKISKNTFIPDGAVSLSSFAAVTGKEEAEGPLGSYFDETSTDPYFGEKTWEAGEAALLKKTVLTALSKGGFTASDMDYAIAGDLLNQCVGSTFGLKELHIPFIGIYGACSTMSEGLMLAAMIGNKGSHILVATSSHFAAAERQFRMPLHYGGVRTPTSQWTCTASGACVVSPGIDKPPYITAITTGKIVDFGITDPNNMGAAMAPAAAYTVSKFLRDKNAKPEDYDFLVTGDLGVVGSTLFAELLEKEKIYLGDRHRDCGKMIFDPSYQDVHAGGSGCGCSASVLCGYFLPKLQKGEIKKILFCATGALLSATTSQQGGTIPSVCHLVEISYER
ncbi:MAG: stage V sporulation protein AD [Ruminococcus sp.]|jgi:stage V sporulation protein AD|nr:stage V sporulation protein AD [Ruminococcus sp.]